MRWSTHAVGLPALWFCSFRLRELQAQQTTERTPALVQPGRSKPNGERGCDDAVNAERHAGYDGACDAPRGRNGRGRSSAPSLAVGERRERFRIEEASQHILRDARHVVVISIVRESATPGDRRCGEQGASRRRLAKGEVGANAVVLIAAKIRWDGSEFLIHQQHEARGPP